MNSKSIPILTAEKNILTFWDEALPNSLAGSKAGRVVFDHVLMVDVSSPGDKSEVTYEIERHYPEEYPHPIHGALKKNEAVYAKYAKYIDDYKSRMKGGSQVVAGTPVDNWAMVDTRMAANLKFHGIYTVEALAGVSDGNAGNLGMGMRELRQKAADWLANASDTAKAMETEERNRKLQSQIDQLTENQTRIGEILDALPDSIQDEVRAKIAAKTQQKAA